MLLGAGRDILEGTKGAAGPLTRIDSLNPLEVLKVLVRPAQLSECAGFRSRCQSDPLWSQP